LIKLLDILKEAKQVGTLYHYTYYSALEKILKTNQLKAYEGSINNKGERGYSISFTRDKQLHRKSVASLLPNGQPEIRIEIDGDKLSEKYRIEPYAAGNFQKKFKSHYEAEERIISDKKFSIPIKDYIKGIDILTDYSDKKNYWWMLDRQQHLEIQKKFLEFCEKNNIPVNIVDKNGNTTNSKEE
jgi:hypothetical protein